MWQRKINLKNSRAKLEELLAANFREGSLLLTLTYEEGTRTPSRELAKLQLTDYLRAVRLKSGAHLRYIRATEWGTAGSCPIHRVVLAPSGASETVLTVSWTYGLVKTEPVSEDGQKALAALLLAPALCAGRNPVHCCRSWSPSKGLIRLGKEEKQDALSEPCGRGIPQRDQVLQAIGSTAFPV